VKTYVILLHSGLRSPEELGEDAERSRRVDDEDMPDDIRWIRSYVLDARDGGVGTVCVYKGSSEEKVREHAKLAGLPVDDVVEALGTVIVRPDPEPAAV
jgi:hypothetical protein